MLATFVELPAFQRYRQDYLGDEDFRRLQVELLKNPLAGDVIADTGGLRKLRWFDRRRGKGKRGGLRIIYYWLIARHEIWLFTIYDKDEAVDLAPDERKILAHMLKNELKARKYHG